jgi:acid phosphatase type 7
MLGVLGLCAIGFLSHAATAMAADPVIAAAGDVACSSSSSNFNGGNGTADKCRQKHTSDLLVNAGLSAVLVLGDAQYESGTLSGFRNSYDLSWGRVKTITRPAPGNHEYKTTNAAGYFDYFNGTGQQTGPAGDRSKGYHSFNVGTWHLIALNSTDHCTIIACSVGSAQEQWLKADLAANADKYCTLAYWHDPRFNSGHDGNADEMQPLFQALYNADADVILGGHAHDYERFAPQNPSGQLDNARGIRQFVVGTGGAFFTSVGTPKPNSLVRQNNTYGVLKLTLHPTSYDWQFVSESNKPFTDSGTGQCHGSTPPPPSDTTKPTAPTSLTANAGSGQVALGWNASTDNVGVTGYKVYRGGTEIASLGNVTSYTDPSVAGSTTYSYTVRALDAASNLSDPSNTATVTTPATTTLTIAPEADARVQQANPTTNYATSNLRSAGDAGAAVESFLRFTVTGVSGGVQNAKLRLFNYNGTADGPAVYSASSPWSESTVNWNTRPARTSGATDDKGAITVNTWVEYNVTPFVTGNGTYTFNVAGPSADGIDFRSREYATNRPELVVTTGSADTQMPGPPGNLQATPSAGQVALSWQAASDNVGVTGYRVFRGTTQIATLGGTARSHTDTGLGAGTYSYTVRAVDAAGNVSDPSNSATATVPDTMKPSAPGNLQATAVGSSRIDLTWEAASDDVAVAGYEIHRDGALLTTIGPETSYSDGVLAPATHTYFVRALDAAGNVSDPSNSATATVLPPDTSDPTPPYNLTATALSSSRIDLAWQASTDDVGVTGYRIYRGGGLLASVGAVTSYSDTTVAAGNTYSYEVRAVDGDGHLSGPSNTATATTPAHTVRTIAPDADAQVNAGAPTTNYATAKLRTDFDSTPEDSFLRFTVTGVTGSVQSAKLRLFAYTDTVDGPAVYSTTNSWTETALTWNTRPPRTSAARDDKGAIATNSWVEFDVTPFVTGNGTYSFTLAQSASDGVDIRSREYTSNRPELVVTAP